VKKMTMLDRLLLLLTGGLAAYQVAVAIEGLPPAAVVAYTVAFGVLLVAGLLLIILGFEILETPFVVIVATLIPLGLAVGLVAEYLPGLLIAAVILAGLGLLAVLLTRLFRPGLAAALTLAVVHGISGLLIFGLPLVLSLNGAALPGFALVGIGGGLIGVGGLLLSFLKTGHPLLSRQAIFTILPGLLLLTTAAFVGGFWLR
jgi:hypothetical protein